MLKIACVVAKDVIYVDQGFSWVSMHSFVLLTRMNIEWARESGRSRVDGRFVDVSPPPPHFFFVHFSSSIMMMFAVLCCFPPAAIPTRRTKRRLSLLPFFPLSMLFPSSFLNTRALHLMFSYYSPPVKWPTEEVDGVMTDVIDALMIVVEHVLAGLCSLSLSSLRTSPSPLTLGV